MDAVGESRGRRPEDRTAVTPVAWAGGSGAPPLAPVEPAAGSGDAAGRRPGEDGVPPAEDLVLDRYRLLRRLGAGGFGVVWLARDERLEREVAVKVMPRAATAGERAAREAHAAARLSHAGIATLFEAGADGQARYLVSELVRGSTLAELYADDALSDRDILRVGMALCDALDHAHARGVIHRDVKPQNVMVPDRPHDGGGIAKLMDFGVARLVGDEPLTRTGDVVGTLAYMAPEQAEGLAAEEPADLYSLGIVLYEGLAGFNPVRGPSPAATARRLGRLLPPLVRERPDLPRELCAAIDRAVLPRPQERGTLEQLRVVLADDLVRVDDAGRALPGSPLEGLREPRAVVLPTRVGAGVLAGGGAWVVLSLLVPSTPVDPAGAAAGVALAVALLPRLAWLLAAAGLVTVLAGPPESRVGTALVLAAGVIFVPLLLPVAGRAWSVGILAPALGLAGLSAAFPALAGAARTWWRRAALGAIGFWWLALAEAASGRTLLFGPAAGTDPRSAWEESPSRALEGALGPLLGSGLLLGAAAWAAAAAVLPWLVRGRSLPLDAVAAGVWCAGVIAAHGAVGDTLRGAVARPDGRGMLAGALFGVVLSLLAAAFRDTGRWRVP
jgi:eukaryotic-like serine/threonine-protein kinase